MANLITTETINTCGRCLTTSDVCLPKITTNRGSESIDLIIITNQSRLVYYETLITSPTGEITLPPTFNGYAGQIINITATVGANTTVYFLCDNGEYYNEISVTLIKINTL